MVIQTYQCIELGLCYRNNWVYQRTMNQSANGQPTNRVRIGTREADLYQRLSELFAEGWRLNQVVEVSVLHAGEKEPYRLYYLDKVQVEQKT